MTRHLSPLNNRPRSLLPVRLAAAQRRRAPRVCDRSFGARPAHAYAPRALLLGPRSPHQGTNAAAMPFPARRARQPFLGHAQAPRARDVTFLPLLMQRAAELHLGTCFGADLRALKLCSQRGCDLLIC